MLHIVVMHAITLAQFNTLVAQNLARQMNQVIPGLGTINAKLMFPGVKVV